MEPGAKLGAAAVGVVDSAKGVMAAARDARPEAEEDIFAERCHNSVLFVLKLTLEWTSGQHWRKWMEEASQTIKSIASLEDIKLRLAVCHEACRSYQRG